MVAALPACPAATAAEEALSDVPELVGELMKVDTAALGLMTDVTFVASCKSRLLVIPLPATATWLSALSHCVIKPS